MSTVDDGEQVTKLGGERRSPEALAQRLYDFALRTIRLIEALPRSRTASRVLGDQLLRAATSVAANYEEARGAVSHADFVAKLGVVYKECRESVLWLSLIQDAGLVSTVRMDNLLSEAKELRAIIGSSMKTARENRRSSKGS